MEEKKIVGVKLIYKGLLFETSVLQEINVLMISALSAFLRVKNPNIKWKQTKIKIMLFM